MTRVASWVRELTESVFGRSRLKVGLVVTIGGRLAEIVSGAFWGEYGVSNHWTYKFLKRDGSLGSEGGNGYDGTTLKWKPLTRAQRTDLQQRRKKLCPPPSNANRRPRR